MGMGGQPHAPAALPPGNETRYPLYRRLGGPQGRYGRVQKFSPPPGFDPRIFQPVASRHTDYAIPSPDTKEYNKVVPLLAIKVNRGVEIQWHPILTSTLDGRKWSASYPRHFTACEKNETLVRTE